MVSLFCIKDDSIWINLSTGIRDLIKGINRSVQINFLKYRTRCHEDDNFVLFTDI